MLRTFRRVLRGLEQHRGYSAAVIVTLALTIGADGSSFHEVVGASAFPRHWIYGRDGKLIEKSGTWYTYKGEVQVDELIVRLVMPDEYVGTPRAKVVGGRLYRSLRLGYIHGKQAYVGVFYNVPNGEQIKISFQLRRRRRTGTHRGRS